MKPSQQNSSFIESPEFLRSILDATTNHVAVIDDKGNIRYTNRAWNSFSEKNNGLIIDHWEGVNYLEACDAAAARGEKYGKVAADAIRKVMATGQGPVFLEYPCHNENKKLWFLMRVTSFKLHESSYFSISHQDITEKKLIRLQLEYASTHDALTGLGNRNLFIKQLEHLIAICARRNEQVALLEMDLDGFKDVNDRLGHAGGDAVLKEFGARLRHTLRKADQIYRIAGDEFAVLLEPGQDSLDGALIVARKISRDLDIPVTIKGQDCTVGASIGIAVYPQHGDDPDVLIRKADAAMYEAKKTGQGIAAATDMSATLVLRKLDLED